MKSLVLILAIAVPSFYFTEPLGTSWFRSGVLMIVDFVCVIALGIWLAQRAIDRGGGGIGGGDGGIDSGSWGCGGGDGGGCD